MNDFLYSGGPRAESPELVRKGLVQQDLSTLGNQGGDTGLLIIPRFDGWIEGQGISYHNKGGKKENAESRTRNRGVAHWFKRLRTGWAEHKDDLTSWSVFEQGGGTGFQRPGIFRGSSAGHIKKKNQKKKKKKKTKKKKKKEKKKIALLRSAYWAGRWSLKIRELGITDPQCFISGVPRPEMSRLFHSHLTSEFHIWGKLKMAENDARVENYVQREGRSATTTACLPPRRRSTSRPSTLHWSPHLQGKGKIGALDGV